MKNKPILIVGGEPKSIFFEIFFKTLKRCNFKSPLILITSKNLFLSQMKRYGYKKKLNFLNITDLDDVKINNKRLNIINVNYKKNKNSKQFVKNSFEVAFKILKSGYTYKFINGPINKSNFLDRKYLGVTEYISKKFSIKKNAMLIYNKDTSVCPVTTHLPLKLVSKKINKKLIQEKVELIDDFYNKYFGYRPKIAVTGLNPHCESVLKYNEDKKIITPTIKFLKNKEFKLYGPFAADTIFLRQNRKKYNVILGMYHDQVLSPIKSLKEYDAINITLGLPFLRISPDHGPNIKMANKNLSNPLSLIRAIKFLDQK